MNPFTPSCLLALGALAGASASSAAPGTPQRGQVIFQTSFETARERDAWPQAPFAQWVQVPDGGWVLRVSTADAAKSAMVTLPFDLQPYRGCKLFFQCRARAENVTRPPQEYNGVKFMLHYQSAQAGPYWHNQNGVYGTFDWRTLSFASPIAPDAAGGQISLGLQASAGTVWFDDIRVSVLSPPRPPRP
ncbi:MAG: hypothetical protein QHJ73_08360, partial [Armatimonadota bacterium]|nr:hypothetical protein [Armatimonadota bacterium]